MGLCLLCSQQLVLQISMALLRGTFISFPIKSYQCQILGCFCFHGKTALQLTQSAFLLWIYSPDVFIDRDFFFFPLFFPS